jgi:aldehyde dehydrogenase (NAD+)
MPQGTTGQPNTLQDPETVAEYQMFIDGGWHDAEEHYEIRNPATEELVARVAKGTVEDADRAVAAAKRAFDEGTWRNTPPADRAALLNDVADRITARAEELTVLQSRENAAPVRVAAAFHVGLPVAHLRYLASLGEKYEWDSRGPEIGPIPAEGYTRRSPIGVCAAIIPYNTPLLLTIWKVAPALVAGNTVVVKPDEKTPLMVLELAKEFEAAGLPPGVFNVVTGDGEDVGARLAEHPDVRKIAFTGSTEVGRGIMRAAASNVKRVTLELGGKSPSIVLDDADVDMAVDGTLYGFLAYSGQACESGTRLLVSDKLHDEFVEKLVARINSLRLGDPLDPATGIGPVVSKEQQNRVLKYIEIGKQEGATLAAGGRVPEGEEYERGYWVEPTIFTDVTNDMRIAREEIFGPVLCVLRYKTVDEAIEIANDTEYGLAGGVWGTDEKRALEVADRIDAGTVWVNDWHVFACEYPFGGSKQSGLGRELGPNALDEYTEAKFISVDRSGGLENKPYALVLG